MSLHRPPKSAVAALAAVTAPLPLHLVGKHRQIKHHRVLHATVVAAKPQSVGERQRSSGATRSTLLFRASHRSSRNWAETRRPRAHAAGDPGVTISDFKFTPSSITIHVGDTITWTNNGPTAHTATDKGVFDTGTLSKGQSASHTFSQAGTFNYICTIHPFMHGAVVVLANAASSSGSNSGSSGSTTPTSTTPTSTTPTASSGPSLPNTGLDVVPTIAVALLLVGAGAALSRKARSG